MSSQTARFGRLLRGAEKETRESIWLPGVSQEEVDRRWDQAIGGALAEHWRKELEGKS